MDPVLLCLTKLFGALRARLAKSVVPPVRQRRRRVFAPGRSVSMVLMLLGGLLPDTGVLLPPGPAVRSRFLVAVPLVPAVSPAV